MSINLLVSLLCADFNALVYNVCLLLIDYFACDFLHYLLSMLCLWIIDSV